MCAINKRLMFISSIVLLIFLPACTTVSVHPAGDDFLSYSVAEDGSLLSRYMPVFVIENYKKSYNLIGTASAKATEGKKETIYINPQKATIYSQKRVFKTAKNTYTNLVYRIHFKKIPSGLIPFYLGAGKNTGLIVIVTLNNDNKPILYTTVHTCGCYIAFVPTSYMPEGSFPKGWSHGRQSVTFENLPGILKYDEPSLDQSKTMILIRDGSHRVKDISLLPLDYMQQHMTAIAQIQFLDSLKNLPLKDKRTTSFFENSGSRLGYVKESYKFREWLLMSWWALDSKIGEDKVFGKDKNDGILFYTTLKPWDREKSDMRDFVTFLRYWNWNLD